MLIEISTADPAAVQTDCLVGFVFEDDGPGEGALARWDGALDGALSQMRSAGEMKGEVHELTAVSTLGRMPARWLLLVGAGRRSDLTVERAGKLIGQAARHADGKGWQKLVVDLSALDASVLELAESASAAVTVAPWRMDLYKTRADGQGQKRRLSEVVFAGVAPSAEEGGRRAAADGKAVGQAINLARELVTRAANEMTPEALADHARRVAEAGGLEFRCLGRAEMQERGMGCLLGVAQGSVNEPKLAVTRYGRFEGAPVLALVGKGITFDSGGISLKPRDGLENMKQDMAGAASVIGAMQAIAALKPRINVVGICPCAENLPGGSAMRPGDVVRAMNGKTVECTNTDAEGRMILADALVYAQQEEGATHIVDVATLTGACVVALGSTVTGVMGAPQEFVDRLICAARSEGERVWQLPMYEEHKDQLKSDVADIKNVGGRYAGAITGACFLKEFVGDGVNWVHMDIAGTAWLEQDAPHMPKGATGVGIRTLVRLARELGEG